MMFRILLKGFFSLCLLYTGSYGFAQSSADTVARDTIRNKFLPTGIRVGFDALNFAKSRLQDNYNGWEFDAGSVAHRLSVSLNRVGPHTTVKGTSLLATPIAS